MLDEDLCLIGSANFDHRSFRLNFELSLLMHGRELASTLEASLLEDLGHCQEVKADRPAAAFPRRLGEAC